MSGKPTEGARDLSTLPIAQPRHLLGAFSLRGDMERERAQERRRVAADVALARLGVGTRLRSLVTPASA